MICRRPVSTVTMVCTAVTRCCARTESPNSTSLTRGIVPGMVVCDPPAVVGMAGFGDASGWCDGCSRQPHMSSSRTSALCTAHGTSCSVLGVSVMFRLCVLVDPAAASPSLHEQDENAF